MAILAAIGILCAVLQGVKSDSLNIRFNDATNFTGKYLQMSVIAGSCSKPPSHGPYAV